jgi:hypothetical protein
MGAFDPLVPVGGHRHRDERGASVRATRMIAGLGAGLLAIVSFAVIRPAPR